MSNGTIDSIAVSHFNHGSPGFTLHELHLEEGERTGFTSFSLLSTNVFSADKSKTIHQLKWKALLLKYGFS